MRSEEKIESFEQLERLIREAVREGARRLEIDLENGRITVWRTEKFLIPVESV